MDPPALPVARLDVDVDLGFALFFFFLLCFFLLVTIIRCAQMVLDPYSAISVTTYQEEQTEEWWRPGTGSRWDNRNKILHATEYFQAFFFEWVRGLFELL